MIQAVDGRYVLTSPAIYKEIIFIRMTLANRRKTFLVQLRQKHNRTLFVLIIAKYLNEKLLGKITPSLAGITLE